MSGSGRIWVVDDDAATRRLLGFIVEKAGYEVEEFASGREVLATTAALPDAVILDLMMPEVDGVAVLRELMQRRRDLPVLISTAVNDVAQAVEVTKLGAFAYLVKPVDEAQLLGTLRRALAERGTLDTSPLRDVARIPRNIIGSSAAMCRVYAQIERVADSDITVFIAGESGTGKELVSKAIHAASPRSKGEFIDVNCAAIPESLQESELFGHERGAFTGAVGAHPGKFEQSSGGTIFLDEVGEMAPSTQARLLRVLQERQLQRVGGTKRIDLDVRVISASNRDLAALVADGSFRQDLYYRLVVFPIELPPLRQRCEDIPALVEHFLVKHAADAGGRSMSISAEALERLQTHEWVGNVRELENAVHRAMLLALGGRIELGDLPEVVVGSEGFADILPDGEVVSLAAAERLAIKRALDACEGNLSEVARRLGIGRSTLYRKLEEYGLRPE